MLGVPGPSRVSESAGRRRPSASTAWNARPSLCRTPVFEALRQRIRDFHAADRSDDDMAATTLDAKGFRTARGRGFRASRVATSPAGHCPPTAGLVAARCRCSGDNGAYSVAGAAESSRPARSTGGFATGEFVRSATRRVLPWQITLADEDIDSFASTCGRLGRRTIPPRWRRR